MWRLVGLFLSFVLVQWGLLLGEPLPPHARAQAVTKPNIVLIVTDDQRADSLARMPGVQRFLVRRGLRMRQAIVSDPLCCPSRATILTGRYAHSTGVYTNAMPHGGWPVFNASGGEATTIATALDAAGYRTALIGKYLNQYDKAGAHVPPGWDRWFAFVSGRYYGYTIYQGNRFLSFEARPRDYSTDVIARQAGGFIRRTPTDTPFFLMVTPYAPHGPSTPALRHTGDLAGAAVNLGPAVNEADASDKPAYIQARRKRSLSMIRAKTIQQWEALLAVDELVSDLVRALRETGRMSNTLFIYTSDNGNANWEHRWPGKRVPYEASVRVPFVARLDGEIPAGTTSNALVSNVDIAPTLARFAGASLPGVDGVSLRPLLTDRASSARNSVLLEYLQQLSPVPTYCGVRTGSFMFTRYATGEEELYDLSADPQQLQNVVDVRPRRAQELRNLTISLCQPTPPGFSW